MVGLRSNGGESLQDNRLPGDEVAVVSGSFPGVIGAGDYFSIKTMLRGLVGEIGCDHEGLALGVRPPVCKDFVAGRKHLDGAAV